jgi:alcohol dehydrogenase class IV
LVRALKHIDRAVNQPTDRDARWNMMSASMQGAMAFQKGLGAVHSLSHALGALPIGPHHGTLNAVLLPEVLKFNEAAVPDKVQAIADVFGVSGGAALAKAIRDLNRRLGLPAGLGDMGIGPELYEDIATQAMKDHCHGTNPRVASHDDYVAMLSASA